MVNAITNRNPRVEARMVLPAGRLAVPEALADVATATALADCFPDPRLCLPVADGLVSPS